MQKIVLNEECWFEPSEAAMRAYAVRKGLTIYDSEESWSLKRYLTVSRDQRPAKPELHNKDRATQNDYYAFEKEHLLDPRKIPRDDPDFVAVVEELGADANDKYCALKIVEIPDGVKWYIEEVGNSEIIHEEHRTWC
jgi:hypothetical protein